MSSLHLDARDVPRLYRVKVTVAGDPYAETTTMLYEHEVDATRDRLYSAVRAAEGTRTVSVDIYPT
ncbi:MAG: hypothetical protein ACRDSK_13735 [Actinophytocola sp.]|uniref:hypothetical protein n=1 Tax=Actinophytocola sp. TaxID=1872138 RepID=UPI003D6A715D